MTSKQKGGAVLNNKQFDDAMNIIINVFIKSHNIYLSFIHFMYLLADILEEPLHRVFPKLKIKTPSHLEDVSQNFVNILAMPCQWR